MELITVLGNSNPKDFSSQLTLFEWNIFRQVSIKELLEYTKQGLAKSQSIQTSVLWFNNISNSIIIDILKPELKQRVDTIQFWIQVGFHCKKLNNFNGVMEVLAALGCVAISRLKKTWNAVSKKYIEMFHDLEELMSSVDNFKEYREKLEKLCNSKASAVPYLGIYLRDIIFVEENPQKLESGKINGFKVDLERQLLSSFINFQQRKYNKIDEDIAVTQILTTWEKSNANTNVENGLYERSILMEPSRSSIELKHNDLYSGLAAACSTQMNQVSEKPSLTLNEV